MVQDMLTSGGGAGNSSVCPAHRVVVPVSCLAYLPPTFQVVGIILGILRLVLHSDRYESNPSASVDANPANLYAVGLDNISYPASAWFFTLLLQIIYHRIGRWTTPPAIHYLLQKPCNL